MKDINAQEYDELLSSEAPVELIFTLHGVVLVKF